MKSYLNFREQKIFLKKKLKCTIFNNVRTLYMFPIGYMVDFVFPASIFALQWAKLTPEEVIVVFRFRQVCHLHVAMNFL